MKKISILLFLIPIFIFTLVMFNQTEASQQKFVESNFTQTKFIAIMNGSSVVPSPDHTSAEGTAEFIVNSTKSNSNTEGIAYTINITGLQKEDIDNIFLEVAKKGDNGNQGYLLFPPQSDNAANLTQGQNVIIIQGKFIEEDLKGPFEGKMGFSLDAVTREFVNENAYVIVYTKDNDLGEIRGQIVKSSI